MIYFILLKIQMLISLPFFSIAIHFEKIKKDKSLTIYSISNPFQSTQLKEILLAEILFSIFSSKVS